MLGETLRFPSQQNIIILIGRTLLNAALLFNDSSTCHFLAIINQMLELAFTAKCSFAMKLNMA